MEINQIAALGAQELSHTLQQVDPAQIDELARAILVAKRIFVTGAGRSLLMLRCLAMRLMHVGLSSYVVGDTTTPAFRKGDLLIAASGSGETEGVVRTAQKAHKLGGQVAVFTIQAASTLGRLGDAVAEIPAYTDKRSIPETSRPLLPGGSLFEQSVLLLGDALVLPLGEQLGIPTDAAFANHANLE